MARHLLTPLALLGLLVALVNLGRGLAHQEEDYYLQELPSREQPHQAKMPVKSGAPTLDKQHPAKRFPDRRAHKGAADAKQGITAPCTASVRAGTTVDEKSQKKSFNAICANGCWSVKCFSTGNE